VKEIESELKISLETGAETPVHALAGK